MKPACYALLNGQYSFRIEDYVTRGTFSGYKSSEEDKAAYAVVDINELRKLFDDRVYAARSSESLRSTVIQKTKKIDDLNESISNYIDRGQNMIQQIKDKDEEIANIKKQLLEKEKELEKEKSLNTNLLRICRENANQKRNIRPKKQRSGYIFLSSEQYDDRKTFDEEGWGRTKLKTVYFKAWKTVFETPYSCFLSQDQAKDLIYADLTEHNLLSAINISKYGDLTIEEAQEPEEYANKMYDTKYKANGRSGLWEVIIMHTLPVDVYTNSYEENTDQD